MITSTKFVHQRQTQNNTPLPSIWEEENVTEATPIGEGQNHDGIASKWGEESEDLIPNYVKDVQEMLRARSEAQPVKPVRNMWFDSRKRQEGA